MTTAQMLTFFIMPVGALVIAGVGVLWVRSWDKDAPKPGE
jgi:hypothetical protein